jgi:hypothetical protein
LSTPTKCECLWLMGLVYQDKTLLNQTALGLNPE